MTNQSELQPITLEFQDFTITSPIEAGHLMIPVKTVCRIIDVDYKNQDNWLKQHPFFAQLYSPSTTTGADGKQYLMSCLSIFDVDGWVHSIGMKGRKEGSIEKQYIFLAWLREEKLKLYKSIEVLKDENRHYAELIKKDEVLSEKIKESKSNTKEYIKEQEKVRASIEDYNKNHIFGQMEINFDNKKTTDS